MGNYEIAGTRGVTIVWDEGGVTSMQGEITDDQWDIFKLAFMTTGHIAVVGDQERRRLDVRLQATRSGTLKGAAP